MRPNQQFIVSDLIAVPTLVLWGESDRIVTPQYDRACARLVPIHRAGHHPELEEPAAFVERVATFLDAGGSERSVAP